MPKVKMSDKMYELVKKLVQIILPATATLYLTLAQLWHLPAAQQVVGTLAATATFLGVCLGLSSKAYNAGDAQYDGHIVVTNTENNGLNYSLELNDDPAKLQHKKAVKFKVHKPGAKTKVAK